MPDPPADVVQFWRQAMAELSVIDPAPTWTPDDLNSTPAIQVYAVRATSLGGIRIAGWFAVPREVGAPRPGLLLTPGYIADPELPLSWAARGYAALSVAHRGKHPATAAVHPGYPGFVITGIEDPATYIYRGVYADTVRCLDLLAARPEVDRSRVGVRGKSQGGALAMVAAALRPEIVRAVAIGCPFLTGIEQALEMATSGPYEEVQALLRSDPNANATVQRTLRYFDCLNLAGAVRAPTLLHVGEQDPVCPAATALRLAELITAPLELALFAGCGHDAGEHWIAPRVTEFLAVHLAPRAPVASKLSAHRTALRPTLSAVRRGAYFDTIDAELAATPPAIRRSPRPSRGPCQEWALEFGGIGNVRLTARLTTPFGPSPHPALLLMPRYGSVNLEPPRSLRERLVCLVINHRAQGASENDLGAHYPGLFRHGVTDPDTFAYRSVLADCLRAFDVVSNLDGVDPQRIGVAGDDLGVLIAARRPTVRSLRVDQPLMIKAYQRGFLSTGAPPEEIQSAHRSELEQDRIQRTLAYFDPLVHAQQVQARTLVSISDLPSAENLQPLLEVLGPLANGYPVTYRDAEDEAFQQQWMLGQLLFSNDSRGN